MNTELRRSLNRLKGITPIKPNAITWENGVEIINEVQNALLPAFDSLLSGGEEMEQKGWLIFYSKNTRHPDKFVEWVEDPKRFKFYTEDAPEDYRRQFVLVPCFIKKSATERTQPMEKTEHRCEKMPTFCSIYPHVSDGGELWHGKTCWGLVKFCPYCGLDLNKEVKDGKD